ncbi:MAG: hypothetical protein ACPGVC_04880 [Salibacteraceae bacterium]
MQTIVEELELGLPQSNGEQRLNWAKTIVHLNIKIADLNAVFLCSSKSKTVRRYLWLLTDIGSQNPKMLHESLPQILNEWNQVNVKNKEASLANYWLVAGIPIQNEGEAINLLFKWLISAKTNISAKARSLKLLFELSKKYPEIKKELKLSLESQLNLQSTDFRKKALNILNKLEI